MFACDGQADTGGFGTCWPGSRAHQRASGSVRDSGSEIEVAVAGVAQQFRALAFSAPAENGAWFPAPTFGGSQMPATLAMRYLTSFLDSSDILSHI